MEKTRIQDDLYEYVNAEWIAQAEIPADRPSVGGFADLSIAVEQLLIGDFNKMAASGNYPDKHVENAVRLFGLVKDEKRRKREGMRPMLADLAKIRKLKDMNAFNRHLSEFVVEGMPLPFSISVDADMKDTGKHCVMLQGPSCILPDTTYYKEEMAQQKQAILALWCGMVRTLLAHTRLTAEEREQYLADTLAFDEIIASLVKSQEEWSEYPKMYNPKKTVREPVRLRSRNRDHHRAPLLQELLRAFQRDDV